MGNQLATQSSRAGADYSAELVNVVFKETLGPGRLLKSLLCVHDNGGLVVVKVFDKRKDFSTLAVYKQQLEAIRSAVLGLSCPHVWPMQLWWETPHAGYMMRQYFFANLYERLSTRPFLTALEKRWITFQLLHAVSQAHARGVCHGDIKCENVMVTSWNWVFLTDFASYKPTYLPADNPADFSYYFDTGGRRRCYLAPERFFEGSPTAINTAAPLQQDMDVFSLGCVIAELWLGEGRAFFDLGTLLAYRRGEYDPAKELAAIEPDIAELVLHMISRTPGDRWSADQYLTNWPQQLFPPAFSEVLHPFFNSLLPLDPDARLAAVANRFGELAAAVQGSSGPGGVGDQQQPQAVAAHQTNAGPKAAPGVPGPSTPTTPAAAAGAAGVSSAAIAGIVPGASSAAGSRMRATIDSLLLGASSIQARLDGPGGARGGLVPPAAEDDGICIDDDAGQEPGGCDLDGLLLPGGLTQGSAGAASGGGATQGSADQGTAVDVWYEYQVRQADNQWVPYTPPGSSSSSKDDVVLPAEGGWQWVGGWQLHPAAVNSGSSSSSSTSSPDAWVYAAEPPPCSGSWVSACSDSTTWRRRTWLRRRVRLKAEGVGAHTAAAAGAGSSMAADDPHRRLQQQQGLCGDPGAAEGEASPAAARDQGMVLLAVLLCTLLRGSRLQESKRAAIMLLSCAALSCDDEVRLQTVVPYLLTQLSDPHAAIRALALRCIVAVMSSLSRLPPADVRVYNDYLLPSLSLLPNDHEEAVRVAYAQALADLAAAAHEHLLGMTYNTGQQPPQQQQQQQTRQQQQHSKAASGRPPDTAAASRGRASHPGALQQGPPPAAAAGGSGVQPVVRYDAEMEAVRSAIEKVVLELVAGLRSSPDIKRGLLSHAGQLGRFFGRRATTDQLLPPLYTCLNDHVEWRLRSSFYAAIAALGPHTGHLDIFMLPYLDQALHDSQPAVACDALRCWAAVCGHLSKRSLLTAARQVVPLLQHTSAAVRHAAVAFIAAVARALPPADVYAQLAVVVAGRLQEQPLMLTDEEHLAACLQPPHGAASTQRQPDAAQPPTNPRNSSALLQPRISTSGGLWLTPPGAAAAAAAAAEGVGGRRRATLGALGPEGHEGGGLTAPPSPGAAPVLLQHSMSERPSSRGGAAARLSLPAAGPRPSTPRLLEPLSTDGSSLLLHPSAPIYACDLDLAALGGVDAPPQHPSTTQEGTTPEAPVLPAHTYASSFDRSAAAAAPGVAGIGSRCGYRAGGFGPPCQPGSTSGEDSSSSSKSAARGSPALRLTLPPAESAGTAAVAAAAAAACGGVAAAAVMHRAPGAAAPGEFWRGGAAGGCGRGMLTGSNTQLARGPGGTVIGLTAAGSGAGRRPRPRSSHSAAVESIARKREALTEQYNALVEALARDPTSVEAADRQQLERLATTLARLNRPPGHDVRCPAALLTYKMAAITSRVGPTGSLASGGPGDPSSSVFDAVSAAMTTGIGQHLPGLEGPAGGSSPSWRPRGVLAAHLMEHRAAINALATSSNGALLLSGSDDETVKVWDVRRLERDVSFASRLTYTGQSGRIASVCGVLDGVSVASASASGSLHVWRVEYTSKPGGWAPDKYRGITAVRELSPGEGAVLHVSPWANHPALLLYASQRGGVHCVDLRCAKDAWAVPPAPSLGLVTGLVADPSGQHWLAQGTSRGWVCLWDVRFLLCVNSWQHPQRCSIQSMAAAVASPQRLGLASGSLPHAGVPLLYIAAGMQEVGLWDVLDGRCHQVLRVLGRDESQLGPGDTPAALQPQLPSPATRAVAPSSASCTHIDPQLNDMLDAHLAIDAINTPQARLSSVTCLLPLPSGAVLTGGADRCIRLWEPSWPERSYTVAGPVWPDDTGIIDHTTNKLQVPVHTFRYIRHDVGGVPVVEERCLRPEPCLLTPDSSPDLSTKLRMQDLVHSDSITQLAAVQGVSRLLVSGCRDGCIKAWK